VKRQQKDTWRLISPSVRIIGFPWVIGMEKTICVSVYIGAAYSDLLIHVMLSWHVRLSWRGLLYRSGTVLWPTLVTCYDPRFTFYLRLTVTNPDDLTEADRSGKHPLQHHSGTVHKRQSRLLTVTPVSDDKVWAVFSDKSIPPMKNQSSERAFQISTKLKSTFQKNDQLECKRIAVDHFFPQIIAFIWSIFGTRICTSSQ